MNRLTHHRSVPRARSVQLGGVTVTLALSLLTAGPALAQGAPLDLNAYRSMAGALEQAVRDRAVSSGASLSALDDASAAYTSLRPGVRSSLLNTGIERALQSSRAALSRTPADLEAQVDQVRGLIRKVLYDQTLSQLGTASTLPASQGALLANEFGLQGEGRTRFLSAVSARDAGTAARLLRRTAAQKVQSLLSSASASENTTERAASYLALAKATGWFTVVQDAPDTGGLKLSGFTGALTELTQGTTPALAASLETLKRGAADFVSSSTQAVERGSSLPQQPASQTSAQTPAQTSAQTSIQPDTQTPDTQTPVASGLNAADEQRLALDSTYAALARAQTAAGHADLPDARSELGRAAQALERSGLSSTDGYDTLAGALNALQNRTGVRAAEVQAAAAQLGNLERRAGGQPTSALDSAAFTVARFPAPLWSLLFLVVGLLSVYPLYLLNLAFGGRNSYWRAIAAGLGLLFLPLLLHGLGGTLAFVGDLSGVGFLRSLGNLSVFQGIWGLPFWLLLSAAAVALCSYGFRGLCRQFGLLGGSGGSAAPLRADSAQPALDWDEDL